MMETMDGMVTEKNVGIQAVTGQENTLVSEMVNTQIEDMDEEKKIPVNALDLLLGGDTDKIKLPTKRIEITRLSEVYGSPFYVTLQGVSASKWEELQDMALKIQGKDLDIDTNLLQIFVVMESVLDDSGKPLFKNKELMMKFGSPTPKELIKKILLSGEIVSIYGAVSDISGFKDSSIEEVKN